MKCGFELQETGGIIGVAGLGRNIIKSELGVGISAFWEDAGDLPFEDSMATPRFFNKEGGRRITFSKSQTGMKTINLGDLSLSRADLLGEKFHRTRDGQKYRDQLIR
jgi:hypothetical protein